MKTTPTKKYDVSDIVYDTDYYVNENDLDLPAYLTIEVPVSINEKEELEDFIGNAISDKTGFCIYSFEYNITQQK